MVRNSLKLCTVCKQKKELSLFYKMAASKDKHSNRCKDCDNKTRIRHIENNRIRHAELARNRYLKHRYKISSEDYLTLLKKQDFSCAVCKRHQDLNRGPGPSKTGINHLAVDHNHSTGGIRGLLCNTCNRALGLMNEDINVLQNAIEYLKENTHVPSPN